MISLDELIALGVVERDLLVLEHRAQLAHDLRVELRQRASTSPTAPGPCG